MRTTVRRLLAAGLLAALSAGCAAIPPPLPTPTAAGLNPSDLVGPARRGRLLRPLCPPRPLPRRRAGPPRAPPGGAAAEAVGAGPLRRRGVRRVPGRLARRLDADRHPARVRCGHRASAPAPWSRRWRSSARTTTANCGGSTPPWRARTSSASAAPSAPCSPRAWPTTRRWPGRSRRSSPPRTWPGWRPNTRKGRRLYVGTTDLDGRRQVVWDVGAIATQGTPEAAGLIVPVAAGVGGDPGLLPAGAHPDLGSTASSTRSGTSMAASPRPCSSACRGCRPRTRSGPGRHVALRLGPVHPGGRQAVPGPGAGAAADADHRRDERLDADLTPRRATSCTSSTRRAS